EVPVLDTHVAVRDARRRAGRSGDCGRDFKPPIQLIFFFTDTDSTEICALSLHDALPIFSLHSVRDADASRSCIRSSVACSMNPRSEEHTSELQSRFDLVCRLLPQKKNYWQQFFLASG